MTEDSKVVTILRVLRELLHNRHFQVHLLADQSRWQSQRNGLLQRGVLTPLLFKIYTSDQPLSPNTSRFMYADDLALTSQASNSEEVDVNLRAALCAFAP